MTFNNECSVCLLLLKSFQLGWWVDFIVSLLFSLKVLGFRQLKKSRQGQRRWMTSMVIRYLQGCVIETNEPCYISWDTESCCSKIHRLIKLKLEAPNLSTDHWCHRDPEEELSQRAHFNGLFFFLYLDHFCFLLIWALFTCKYTRSQHSDFTFTGILAFLSLSLSLRYEKNWTANSNEIIIHTALSY